MSMIHKKKMICNPNYVLRILFLWIKFCNINIRFAKGGKNPLSVKIAWFKMEIRQTCSLQAKGGVLK